MMASVIKAVVLLCLFSLLHRPIVADVAEVTWDSQEPGITYRAGYKAINEFLEENVGNSATMPANLDALIEKLNSGGFGEQEVRVVRKLNGLRMTADKCNQISYQCLNDNDEARDYELHDVTSAPRRIDDLINYYGKQHAISCQKKIESLFKPKMELLDRQILHRLSIWLDPIIDTILTDIQTPENLANDFSSKAFHGIIKNFYLHHAVNDHRHAYDVIKTLVKDNPDDERYLHYYSDEPTEERHFHREKFGDLIEKYFGDSCRAYLGQMNELFERADIDARFYHNVNSNEPLFYRGWAYTKICSSLFDRAHEALLLGHVRSYAREVAEKEEAGNL